MPSYRETIQYLYRLRAFGIRPGLGRIRTLLGSLGDPHERYPTILVAGTNGKGSTSAMIASVLATSGCGVGLYTSPHLVRYNERIRIGDEPISSRDVVRFSEIIRRVISRDTSPSPTFFEFTTALAFAYFAHKGVDLAVVEVGMGGRLDATNVVNPSVSVITGVAVEHTDYLGSTVAEIAREKAGVIRRGGAVVCAALDAPARAVITATARSMGAELFLADRDFSLAPATRRSQGPGAARRFDFLSNKDAIKGIELGLSGQFQVKNAALAIKALQELGRSGICVNEGAIRRGLKRVKWPARFEVVGKRPLVVVDSAHNPAAAAALADALTEIDFRRLILVVGFNADKDIAGILAHLCPLADSVILTRSTAERAADPAAYIDLLGSYKPGVMVRRRVGSACRLALENAGPGDVVCIAGSVFVAGEARSYLLDRLRAGHGPSAAALPRPRAAAGKASPNQTRASGPKKRGNGSEAPLMERHGKGHL